MPARRSLVPLPCQKGSYWVVVVSHLQLRAEEKGWLEGCLADRRATSCLAFPPVMGHEQAEADERLHPGLERQSLVLIVERAF